jgi:hypothetical protein
MRGLRRATPGLIGRCRPGAPPTEVPAFAGMTPWVVWPWWLHCHGTLAAGVLQFGHDPAEDWAFGVRLLP